MNGLRFPKSHLADEVTARIMVAAKRIRDRDAVHIGELAPELAGQPGPSDSALQGATAGAAAAAATAAATAGPQPGEPPTSGAGPLDGSGLDQGAMMRGSSSFDALAEGISDQQSAGVKQ